MPEYSLQMFSSEKDFHDRDVHIREVMRAYVLPDVAWLIANYALEDQAQKMLWDLLHIQNAFAYPVNQAYKGLLFMHRGALQGAYLKWCATPIHPITHLAENRNEEAIRVFVGNTDRIFAIDVTFAQMWAFLSEDASRLEAAMEKFHGKIGAAEIKRSFRRLLVDYIVREECAAKARGKQG